MLLWIPILAMLCRRAVPMLWHASSASGSGQLEIYTPFFPYFADWWFPLLFTIVKHLI
jgi:hypothetical protein